MSPNPTFELFTLIEDRKEVMEYLRGNRFDKLLLGQHEKTQMYQNLFHAWFSNEQLVIFTLISRDLLNLAIPHSIIWKYSNELGNGKIHTRFTGHGVPQTIKNLRSERDPPLHDLMNLVDDPVKLAKFVRDFHKSKQVIPWRNQAEFRKRYKTKKLVGAI